MGKWIPPATPRNAAIDRAKDAFRLAQDGAYFAWNLARIDKKDMKKAHKDYESRVEPARDAYKRTVAALGGDEYDTEAV